MSKQRVLTGITTTGSPHLGNYVGAIRPAIAASRDPGVESFYFLADYHALVKCQEPERVQRSTLEIAATWLACGLDTERVFFYRQSDVPEVAELTWFLTCICAKGLLNRAHAYKAAVDANTASREDPDAGISAGLYMYPVLMAADILLFNAHRVPVGRDQVQHIEIARDLAQRFNHVYGGEYFTLPEAAIEEQTAILPGLDGRKMSKSYDNTIPLWLPQKELRKALLGIVTNSLAPGEAKDPESSHIFTIYRAFASAQETTRMREAFAAGIAWGDAKQALYELIERELGEARERYQELIGKPERIEQILLEGADKAKARALPDLQRLRHAVGLRPLTVQAAFDAEMVAARAAEFTNWTAATFTNPFKFDQTFGFRVQYGDDAHHLLVEGIRSAKDAGLEIHRLRSIAPDALDLRIEKGGVGYELAWYVDGVRVARGIGVDDEQLANQALAQLRGALTAAYTERKQELEKRQATPK